MTSMNAGLSQLLLCVTMTTVVMCNFNIDPQVCNMTAPQDIKMCEADNYTMSCNNNPSPVCEHAYTYSVIDISPHDNVVESQINETIILCCDPCRQLTQMKKYKNSLEFFYAIANGTEQSAFVYPVLGTKSTQRLYNRYFLPVIDIPKATLMTLQKNGTMMFDEILGACLDLVPLLSICLLMALASGFIIWLLDTWSNEEQFPRNILFGVYEGFWWAFISMTTVGYGDKTPISVFARIFGILWILVGITMCSMLTASLTAVITNVKLPPTTDITGKNIIVMPHRLLDATFVLSGGGIIYPNEKSSSTEIMNAMYQDDNIYGLISDYVTAAYFRKHVSDIADKYDFQDMDYSSNGYTYGVLVKDKDLFEYLEQFFVENRLFITSCQLQILNDGLNPVKGSRDPFDPANGAFWKAFYSISAMCGAFFFFGAVYEIVKRCIMKVPRDTNNNKMSEQEIINNMKTLLDQWSLSKKEKNINA